MGFVDKLYHAWNSFTDKSSNYPNYSDTGPSYSYRPDRPRLTRGNERSIITSVFNRIAIDASAISIEHVRLDDDRRYLETINSGLNNCLTLNANIDQTGRGFIQDAVMSLLDEGAVAIIPTDTSIDPALSSSYDILELRVGKIIAWYPKHIKVTVYNETTGLKQDIVVSKKDSAIIENPFYSVMNEPNSTMQRLIRKLNILDSIDEQSGAGKLDLIIQLPYVIKTEARRRQAEDRRKDIEAQLSGSKYGIAYTDGTENITQLNRSVENNLMTQIEYLTSMLYSQLGLTTGVMDGSANAETINNYYVRILEPLLSAITNEIKRKFLTKTARSQNQSIMFFKDPFKLVPISNLSDIADKFTRNEILSSNEVRQIIGMKPSSDPNADELRNKNLNVAEPNAKATPVAATQDTKEV